MREKWTDEEMILTLYIYLTHDSEDLHKYSKFLIDFTDKLNEFTGNKRTPSSIEMRISNYKSVDPNYYKTGLANGGKSVKYFWDKYNNQIVLMEKLYLNFFDKTKLIIDEESKKELDEIEKTAEYKNINIDDKDGYIETMINLRNGAIQRIFRQNLLVEFNNKCALCDINNRSILISSHILPYSKCIKKEDMINHNNGLLLCPNHDALFDKKLITFNDDGKIIISKNIDKRLYGDLNLNTETYINKKYLNYERLYFLKKHYELYTKEKNN